jgi:uncharacterized protein
MRHLLPFVRALALPLVLAAALAPAAATAAPAQPVTLAPAAADSLRAAIDKERVETLDWLSHSSSSYLATVQRRDFDGRPAMVVGRAPDCDVRIDDPAVADHHLRVTVVGDGFHVEALAPDAVFTVRDSAVRTADVGPSAIGLARYTLRLSHQRFPAIIVFDPQSPRFADDKGLAWYPVDFAYRFELPLTPAPKPEPVIILSTRGNQRRALRVGWFEFEVGGKPCRLEATRLLEPGVDENSVGVFFRDLTSGVETYALGRYVDAEPLGDGRYRLDFNLAYNPACAVSEHYNCPIPPKANTLKVAIKAGEKDSHYHE